MADDESGVLATIEKAAPDGWRKHVAAVLFQLGLGTRRTAEMYARGREAIDISDGRALVNKALAQAVANQAIADPEMMERAKARFLSEAFTKQENLEAVLQGAEQQLLLGPPNRARGSVGSENNETVPEAELDRDWAAAFTREAELASSDELRSRLSKLLSGEIAQPGSYTRSTIRLVAEMDRDLLEEFQKVLPYIASNGIIVTGDWSSGEFFSIGMRLDDAGLVNGVTGSTHKRYVISEDGYITLSGNDLALVIHGKPGAEKRISCWLLSKAGIAIASLLPETSRRPALQNAVKELDKADLTKIEIGKLIYNDLGSVILPEETIWQSEVDAVSIN